MEIHIQIVGVLLIGLAALHFFFPRQFNWVEELKSLSLLNRQMMYIHTFFVAFVVLLMGLLCLSSADDLINTPLGRRVSLGLGIFWATRLVIQFVGYSSTLWRGKKRETIAHILLSIFWMYLTYVFITTSFP